MSDPVVFTEQEQDELDSDDAVQWLWGMKNEARWLAAQVLVPAAADMEP